MIPTLNAILPVTIVSLVAICVWAADKRTNRIAFVAIFACAGIAADLALHIGRILPVARFGGSMNWEGKTVQLFVVLVMILIFSTWIKPKEMGLTLTQNSGSLRPSLQVAIGFVLFVSSMAWLLQNENELPTFEVLAWNLCVFPDFVEELVFRGLLLALLLRAFPNQRERLGVPFGVAFVLTCFLFGLEHGIRFRSDYSLQISWGAVLRTAFISGPIFAWLRMKTGSLLLPTLAHAGVEAASITLSYV